MGFSFHYPKEYSILCQDYGFFEIVRGCTFDIAQTYLAIRRSVEVNRASEGNVGWFPYNGSDGVVSDIPAGDGPGRRCSIDDEVISRNFVAVKVTFFC